MVYFWSHESAEFDIIYFVFLMCVVCLTYFKGTFVIAFGVVVLLAFSMASRYVIVISIFVSPLGLLMLVHDHYLDYLKFSFSSM